MGAFMDRFLPFWYAVRDAARLVLIALVAVAGAAMLALAVICFLTGGPVLVGIQLVACGALVLVCSGYLWDS